MEQARNNRMRKLWTPRRGTLIPGAANALAARIIESVEFEAVLFTGAGHANTDLGMPDVGLTSVSDVVEQVAAMRAAIEIPILADATKAHKRRASARRLGRAFCEWKSGCSHLLA
jgi:2-methylisocitrate lyase-like PEP mutase family enzyme